MIYSIQIKSCNTWIDYGAATSPQDAISTYQAIAYTSKRVIDPDGVCVLSQG